MQVRAPPAPVLGEVLRTFDLLGSATFAVSLASLSITIDTTAEGTGGAAESQSRQWLGLSRLPAAGGQPREPTRCPPRPLKPQVKFVGLGTLCMSCSALCISCSVLDASAAAAAAAVC